jgi:hypothetical protein
MATVRQEEHTSRHLRTDTPEADRTPSMQAEQAIKELRRPAQQEQDGVDRMPMHTEVRDSPADISNINTTNPHGLHLHARNLMATLPGPNQTRQSGQNRGLAPIAMDPNDGQRPRKKRGREKLRGRGRKTFKSDVRRKRKRSKRKSGGKRQKPAKWSGRGS